MGREVKRVALDFDWPLEKTWEGFLNPFYKYQRDCPFCDGDGYNEETHQLSEDWYDFEKTGRRWCDSITQDEVQALIDQGRLMDFTHHMHPEKGWTKREPLVVPSAEEVNAWNAGRGLGHDAINRMICIETRAKRLGVYGHCEFCKGEGEVWLTEQAKLCAEDWKPTEPPSGEGWQVWETVSEGSPVTRVFPTAEALAQYLAKFGDLWCQRRGSTPPSLEVARKFVASGSVPSMVAIGGKVREGINCAEEYKD